MYFSFKKICPCQVVSFFIITCRNFLLTSSQGNFLSSSIVKKLVLPNSDLGHALKTRFLVVATTLIDHHSSCDLRVKSHSWWVYGRYYSRLWDQNLFARLYFDNWLIMSPKSQVSLMRVCPTRRIEWELEIRRALWGQKVSLFPSFFNELALQASRKTSISDHGKSTLGGSHYEDNLLF